MLNSLNPAAETLEADAAQTEIRTTRLAAMRRSRVGVFILCSPLIGRRSAMVPPRVGLAVLPLALPLVLLLPGLPLLVDGVAACAERFSGRDRRRRRGAGVRPVALVGGYTGSHGGVGREAATGTGVVELDER